MNYEKLYNKIKAVTGRKKSKEELEKITRKGSNHTAETKLKMSKTRTGVKRGPYKKHKIINNFFN